MACSKGGRNTQAEGKKIVYAEPRFAAVGMEHPGAAVERFQA
jgi:hypothetical protein